MSKEQAIWKLVEAAITAFQIHGNRDVVVGEVRKLEEQGLTNDQITDAIQKGRQESEATAQRKIDAATE